MNIRPVVPLAALSVVIAGVIAALFRFGPAEERAVDLPGFARTTPVPAAERSGSARAADGTQSRHPVPESRRDRPDWAREARESTDHFSLAQQMAGPALAGDTRADYVLGNVLLQCEVYKRILAPYTVGTVEQRVEYHLANSTLRLSDPQRARIRREALRCGRIFSENPFEGYDLPEEATDFRYWSNRAVENGDPLATTHRVFRDAIGRRESDDPEKERAYREGLRNVVRQAAHSGDAAALFVVGGMLSHPGIVADPEIGLAWMVAACESGYDCSNANPDVGFGCVELGMCEPGRTRLDTLQEAFGAGKYAAIYANAQDIQYKIRTNDWDGLQQYVNLKE